MVSIHCARRPPLSTNSLGHMSGFCASKDWGHPIVNRSSLSVVLMYSIRCYDDILLCLFGFFGSFSLSRERVWSSQTGSFSSFTFLHQVGFAPHLLLPSPQSPLVYTPSTLELPAYTKPAYCHSSAMSNPFPSIQVTFRRTMYTPHGPYITPLIITLYAIYGILILINVMTIVIRWYGGKFWIFRVHTTSRGRIKALVPNPVLGYLLWATLYYAC